MAEYITTRRTTSSVKPLYRGTQVVWYILNVIEVLLAFRFLLKLFGANSAATFSQIVYGVTDFLVAPFLYVFRINQVAGAVFEWPTLLAMAVYWLLAWAIVRLFTMARPVSEIEAEEHLEAQDPV